MVLGKDAADEDPQSRLVVNKRLSKAVSAAPRARFQRARPNVPNSKRTDSNSSQPKVQKPSINPEDTKNDCQQSADKEKTSNRTQKLPIYEETENFTHRSADDETTNCYPKSSLNIEDSKENSHQTVECEKTFSRVQTACANKTGSKIQASSEKVADKLNSENSTLRNASISTNLPHLRICNDDDPVKFVSDANSTASNEPESGSVSDIWRENDADSFLQNKIDSREREEHKSKVTNELCVPREESLSGTGTTPPDLPRKANKIPSENLQSKSHKDLNGYFKNSVVEATVPSTPVVETTVPSTPVVEATVLSTPVVEATVTNTPVVQITIPVTPVLEAPVQSTPVISDRASKYPQLTSILSKKRAEPKKDVQQKRRRKYKKGDVAPERSKMTMADLIYWNPTSTDEGMKKTPVPDVEPISSNGDDPAEGTQEEEEEEVPAEEDNVCDSVPKLVISEDGTINIDQVSLVVSRKRLPDPPINEVARNEETTYSSFRKRPLSKQWSSKDTYVFYKALSLVGTDFGLMEKLLPNRTRRELKMKFKREEKYNIDLINRAMYESHLTFDAKTLEAEIQSLNSVGIDINLSSSQEDLSMVNENTTTKRKRTMSGKKPGNENEISVSESTANCQELKKGSNRKKNKKLSETSMNIEHSGEESLLKDESTKGVQKNKVGRKRKQKYNLSESEDDTNDSVTCMKDETNKRKRKKKTLPDCYVDIDDVDFELNIDETTKDTSRSNSPTEYYIDDQACPYEETAEACDNSTNIEILLVEGPEAEVPTTLKCNQTTVVMDKASVDTLPHVIQQLVENDTLASPKPPTKNNCRKSAPQKLKKKNLLTTNNSEKQDLNISENEPDLIENPENLCIENSEIHANSNTMTGKTVLVRNVSTNEVSVPMDVCFPEPGKSGPIPINLDCVMANEVVTSVEPPPKKARKKPNPSEKPKFPRKLLSTEKAKTPNPVQPSFLNYTPTETDVNFSPKSNMRTYLNSPKNRLVTSLQTPALTPENSSCFTTLKKSSKSSTLPFTIPVSPELTSAKNPVMLFAQSPSEDNVIHLFMYNEQNE